MARRTNYCSTTKTIAATTPQTISWSSSEIQSERVVAYHFGFTNAGNTVADITRIRVSASGVPIYNLSGSHLRAFLERYTRSNFNLATTAQRFTLPFYLPDAPTQDLADVCQFPRRSQVQIDISLGAATAAGIMVAAYTETNVEAELSPKLLASAMGLAASQANIAYNFQERGIVRGVCFPVAGIDRARVVVAGETAIQITGAEFLGAVTGDLWAELAALDGGGVSMTTEIFQNITLGKSAPLNSSFVELTTGPSWVGVTNELCLYAVVPNVLEPAM